VTSFRLGRCPSRGIASTCSVTSIEPSSEAIPARSGRQTKIPVSVGPSSRTSAIETTSPVSALWPKRVNCEPVCRHDDADEKAGEKEMGSEPTPMFVHLVEKILEIVRAAEKITERASGEEGVFPERRRKLHALLESTSKPRFCLPTLGCCPSLERRVGHLSLFRD